VLARSRDRAGVLSAATGGDLSRSRRWREFYAPYGIGDELRTVVADERGCWGTFQLFRDSDDPPFDADDAQLMRDASRLLARALRRGALARSQGPWAASPTETGVLILDDDLRPLGSTGSAQAWFRALDPAGMPHAGGIPSPVWSVVGRLLAAEGGEDPGRAPRARVRAGDGRWAIVEAARLDGAGGAIAVSVHPAGTEDILGLLWRVYALSARERELVALLVEGLDTREMAQRLVISRYTVQDHLKSVFGKVGVQSRRELLSGLFAQAA
jgi:DNA-binding CsgD family transcriptional regulator